MLTMNCVNHVNPLLLMELNPIRGYISFKYLNKSKKRGCIINHDQPLFTFLKGRS
ncbi:hypothetical protein SAMN05421821_102176 [Mucilaginibacter lappiensis]|uniref:Uncharacterized protein n=1 Tax=Mucilaginibacter lappiensis TaxID=354630 RepID=A0ABR6PK22_9SPHI|nr:hypothetical protein [Mucilaginibacter lappiensis]SIQ31994.1 hypothetical protein SAMN05421821_102176 [Mucilaginibacter lappiensis]